MAGLQSLSHTLLREARTAQVLHRVRMEEDPMRRRMAGLMIALLVSGACGSSPSTTAPSSSSSVPSTSPSPNPANPVTTSSLTLMLKDSPFSDARALLVTFSQVNVHASGGDWVTVPFAAGAASRTCDLKKLETAQDVLGVGSL